MIHIIKIENTVGPKCKRLKMAATSDEIEGGCIDLGPLLGSMTRDQLELLLVSIF